MFNTKVLKKYWFLKITFLQFQTMRLQPLESLWLQVTALNLA